MSCILVYAVYADTENSILWIVFFKFPICDFGEFKEKMYLCTHVSLHSTVTPAAMAEEHVCLCADFFQQQPVEARILLAHIGGVCLILSGFEQYLLLQ